MPTTEPNTKSKPFEKEGGLTTYHKEAHRGDPNVHIVEYSFGDS